MFNPQQQNPQVNPFQSQPQQTAITSFFPPTQGNQNQGGGFGGGTMFSAAQTSSSMFRPNQQASQQSVNPFNMSQPQQQPSMFQPNVSPFQTPTVTPFQQQTSAPFQSQMSSSFLSQPQQIPQTQQPSMFQPQASPFTQTQSSFLTPQQPRNPFQPVTQAQSLIQTQPQSQQLSFLQPQPSSFQTPQQSRTSQSMFQPTSTPIINPLSFQQTTQQQQQQQQQQLQQTMQNQANQAFSVPNNFKNVYKLPEDCKSASYPVEWLNNNYKQKIYEVQTTFSNLEMLSEQVMREVAEDFNDTNDFKDAAEECNLLSKQLNLQVIDNKATLSGYLKELDKNLEQVVSLEKDYTSIMSQYNKQHLVPNPIFKEYSIEGFDKLVKLKDKVVKVKDVMNMRKKLKGEMPIGVLNQEFYGQSDIGCIFIAMEMIKDTARILAQELTAVRRHINDRMLTYIRVIIKRTGKSEREIRSYLEKRPKEDDIISRRIDEATKNLEERAEHSAFRTHILADFKEEGGHSKPTPSIKTLVEKDISTMDYREMLKNNPFSAQQQDSTVYFGRSEHRTPRHTLNRQEEFDISGRSVYYTPDSSMKPHGRNPLFKK